MKPSGAIGGVVSVAGDGRPGDGRSETVWGSVSGDGRYVVFNSRATNLVPGVPGHLAHLYVRDLENRTTQIVDVSSEGVRGNADSFGATISADGRYVAFTSDASNLVPGTTNGVFNVYVHDRQEGVTTRVSVGPGGAEGNAMSFRAHISGNGRFVTFVSMATNLLPDLAGGRGSGCYVRDLMTGTLEMITVNSAGEPASDMCQAPAISGDGRYVAFSSRATNLADRTNGIWNVYLRDRESRTTHLVSAGTPGGEQNGGPASPASPAPPGARGQAPLLARGSLGDTISPDGRYLAFGSWLSNLLPGDVNTSLGLYLRDLEKGTTEKISVAHDGNGANDLTFFTSSISSGGRYVTFASRATNLVPGGTDPGVWNVYLRDRELSSTERVSVAAGGGQADGESAYPVISADGNTIAFMSAASNLVPHEANDQIDVFFWRREGA